MYLKFLVAAAVLFAALYSITTLAANPSSAPITTLSVNSSFLNASTAHASDVIFGAASFTSQNGSERIFKKEAVL